MDFVSDCKIEVNKLELKYSNILSQSRSDSFQQVQDKIIKSNPGTKVVKEVWAGQTFTMVHAWEVLQKIT